jgi:hypothetical protein
LLSSDFDSNEATLARRAASLLGVGSNDFLAL